ncbi:MAG: ABC transporter ATP-binding protein [Candidatus Choladocola sp.]|nr:ABC transporter ATP-binding protein [Candidatus Choladocola sp.]
MMKLIRRACRRWHLVVWIVLLLCIQVFCDLLLPSCTADLINIGIGQQGLSSVLADTVSSEGMKRLLLLMNEEEQQTVLSSYVLEKDIYRRKELSDEEETKLLSLITSAMVAVYALTTDGADYEEVLGEDMYVPRGMDVFALLDMLPDASRLELTYLARERLKQVPESLIVQAAVNFTVEDLNSQGIDTEAVQRNYMIRKGLQMILISLVMIAAALAAAFLADRLAGETADELRNVLFERIITMEKQEVDQYPVSFLVSVTTDDVRKIQQLLGTLFHTVLFALLLGCGVIITTWQKMKGMEWIVTGAVAASAVLMAVLFLFAAPIYRQMSDLTDRYGHLVRQSVCGIMTVRIFGGEKREKERLEKESGILTKAGLRAGHRMSCMMPLLLLLQNGAILLVAWGSASAINQGIMLSGDMVALFQYIMLAATSFLAVTMYAKLLLQGMQSQERIFSILENGEKRTGHHQSVNFVHQANPAIEFSHVSFGRQGTDRMILNDLSFTVDYGETVAVAGSTGSGKTTLLQLIPALIRPTKGSVKIDGKDTAEYDQKELRKKIGYVPQETILFSGTVASNLAFGKKEANEKEMWHALSVSQADEFVRKKEGGLDAEIAHGGSNLSGGQRQRISIARAMVRHPQICLLDDCYSSLDSETCRKACSAIRRETENAAVILVSQNLHTLKSADRILVLEEGRIISTGTHRSLMEKCDTYRKLALSRGWKEGADEE